MKADSDIRRDVEAALRWSPDVDETDIAVKVTDGVVALSGFTASFREKYRAEAAVKRVARVAGVANDIVVRAPQRGIPSDPEIARSALATLNGELPLAWNSLEPTAMAGHVELEDGVAWHHEGDRAEDTEPELDGVLGVRNSIRITPHVAAEDIEGWIEEVFRRNALIDAQRVTVEARGDEVTRAARCARGRSTTKGSRPRGRRRALPR
jgi:osmotically-inducible protein OsmY